MTEPMFVGIDVAKDSFQAASQPVGLNVSWPNNPEGWQELINALSDRPVALIVLEATGGYERALAVELVQAGHRVVVANPRQVRDFARGLGQWAKTDAIDAAVLARFAQIVQPAPRKQLSADGSDLAELVRRRRQLTDLRTQESNRLPMVRHPQVRRSVQKMLKTLDHQIAELEDLIHDHIQSDDGLRHKNGILRSTPGVGPQTSAMLLSDLPELGQLNRQEIAALVGVCPWDCQSGHYVGKARIWGGRKEVRSVLYMAALTALRCNPVIRAFGQRLREQGKAFKVVITACMRKLLVILNTMVRRNEQWNPHIATQNP